MVDNVTTSISGNVTLDGKILVNRIIEGLVLSVICVVALVANISLWVVICRTRELKTEANYLILCLSAADVLVSLAMPITCYTIFRGDWVFSDDVCKLAGFINMVTFVASVMSLGAISINRYYKVCTGQRYKKIYTKRNVFLIILGIWLFSSALATPPLVGWGVYSYLPNQSFCFSEWPASISYTFFMVGVCFGGPCSVMTVSYCLIFRKYRRSARTVLHSSALHSSAIPSNTTSNVNNIAINSVNVHHTVTKNVVAVKNRPLQIEKRRLEELRLTTTLLVMILVFVLSWLPFCVAMFLSVFAKEYLPQAFDMFTLLLGYANSCYNPFIYGIMNSRVKQGYKTQFTSLLVCCGLKKQGINLNESRSMTNSVPDN
ncbi:octopamine receptor Oamb [Patella vulgata]|uniref:octopamine receptor Oamb n=1 Tax=Patella vulgata TaxID=6465 RepID=UPI002180823C|nr:octopamine receptor Oamb [Patella vulgata]